MTTVVGLLDGTLRDVTEPLLRADDLGHIRGDGVFDATLVRPGEVRDREAHLDRLERSAELLDLTPPDRAGYNRAIDAVVGAWDFEREPEAMLKLVLTRGPEGIDATTSFVLLQSIAPSMIREREAGVAVTLLGRGYTGSEVATMPWLLPGAKTLSYAINVAARRHAAAGGFDDVVFVDPAGNLLEGPTSTVVIDRGGVLVTPPQDGILPSITLAQLIQDAPSAGLNVSVEPLTASDLIESEGAWLISSGRLIAPVTSVDGSAIPRSALDADLRRILGV